MSSFIKKKNTCFLEQLMEAVVQEIVKANFSQFSEVHIAPMRHKYPDMSETKSEI